MGPNCHFPTTALCRSGTIAVLNLVCGPKSTVPVDINSLLENLCGMWPGSLGGGGPVESNQSYYRRRAIEERMAAQRAVTETARAWHAKLAEDFAARAIQNTGTAVTA